MTAMQRRSLWVLLSLLALAFGGMVLPLLVGGGR
jgi:hypothetical protein